MSKKYRLLKELPGMKVGDNVVWNSSMKCYSAENICYYGQYPSLSESAIEKHPDFFEVIKEVKEPVRIEVEIKEAPHTDMGIFVEFKRTIAPKDKFSAIKKAIEEVFNPSPSIQPIVEEKGQDVLFITEDGGKIKEGDSVWHISILEGSWKVSKTIGRIEITPPPTYFKYFSTEEAANEYVFNNQPKYSLQWIFDNINELINDRDYDYLKHELTLVAQLKNKQ